MTDPPGGILLRPDDAFALLVLAHGAGAGMRHAFMDDLSLALARRGVATWRYEFPYMAQGRRRPDRPEVLVSKVREAVAVAARREPALPLFAGGKSMGGRMTSTAAAGSPSLEAPGTREVRGLVFIGFPLHPAGRPGIGRADHLEGVDRPMLFLQGDRDRLADLRLLMPVLGRLGDRVHLHVVPGADHGFRTLKRSGRSDAEVLEELAVVTADWMRARVAGPGAPA